MVPALFSGARGKIVIGGKAMAFVTSVDVNVAENVRAVHTFGAPNARSVEPLSTTCSVSIGRVIPVNDGQGNPVDTSAIASGIEPLITLMLQSEDVAVEIVDKITGRTVASIKNCRFAGRSMSVGAQGLASERISMVGIYDAAGNNTPDQLGF
jgi:hypothetical protein